MPRPRIKLLAAGAALALAAGLPVLAQESILPPGFGEQPAASPTPAPATTPARPAAPRPAAPAGASAEAGEGMSAAQIAEYLASIPPPIEMPSAARRDPALVGPLPAAQTGLGAAPWGRASGTFLSGVMRRTAAPLASRWGHILLRNALLTQARAPTDIAGADWAAERAWLLLRMGEADGARLVVSGVDVADFTPKMVQVATQSALANGDPSALCPIEDGIRRHERAIAPLVRAICASLSGSSAVAAADIEAARRRGRFETIDLVLADKVVGAGAESNRAVTLEWEGVDRLTSWRFGLATATGIVPPEPLVNAAAPHVRAWQARSPILSPEARLASARVAAALGVFSSQALLDLYAQIYDSTDPSDLGESDAWAVRQAFVGKDQEARLGAFRRLLDASQGEDQKLATRLLLARAAMLVEPDSDLADIAPDLIAAMLAAGYDRAAARWLAVVGDMGGEAEWRCWAMLALGSPNVRTDVSAVEDFIDDDESAGLVRSKLLVAGLAGLGKLSSGEAGSLSSRFGLGLARTNVFTRTIDDASALGQAGTVVLLAGLGLEAPNFQSVPAHHFYHLITALNRNGQGYAARMIAAEALART